MVDACQGLPLSLEVTGSWLSTKRNPQEWKEGLSQLKNAKPFGEDHIENDKLWGRLRICYIDLAYVTHPNSSMDSNVSPSRKQRNKEESEHTP